MADDPLIRFFIEREVGPARERRHRHHGSGEVGRREGHRDHQ
jgi:hypothetical protein